MEFYQGVDIIRTHMVSIVNQQRDKQTEESINYHLHTKNMIPSNITFKLLIGIGGVKCGTTYFELLLHEAAFHLSPQHLKKFEYHIHKETHYFTHPERLPYDDKWLCSFPNYLDVLLNNAIRTDFAALPHTDNDKTVILADKVPIYFQNQLASNLLTFYANLYNDKLKFWILLRNPVKRVWSNMWMITKNNCLDHVWRGVLFSEKLCFSLIDNKYGLSKYNKEHLKIMQNEAIKLIETSEYSQPLLYKLIKMVSSDDYMDKDWELIDLIHQIQHDKIHYYTDFALVQSCYYPLVLMWYKKYEKYCQQIYGDKCKNDFDDKFKIIQSESMFENPMEIAQEILCWRLEIPDCTKRNNVYWSDSVKDEVVELMKHKARQRQAPSGFDVMDVKISNMSLILKEFYEPCNKRLFTFLEKHPKILLKNSKPLPWW